MGHSKIMFMEQRIYEQKKEDQENKRIEKLKLIERWK